jgi:hypothetical protein
MYCSSFFEASFESSASYRVIMFFGMNLAVAVRRIIRTGRPESSKRLFESHDVEDASAVHVSSPK